MSQRCISLTWTCQFRASQISSTALNRHSSSHWMSSTVSWCQKSQDHRSQKHPTTSRSTRRYRDKDHLDCRNDSAFLDRIIHQGFSSMLPCRWRHRSGMSDLYYKHFQEQHYHYQIRWSSCTGFHLSEDHPSWAIARIEVVSPHNGSWWLARIRIGREKRSAWS